MDSEQRRERTKTRLKELGISTRARCIRIQCSGCKRVYDVQTNHRELYTPEVIKNYKCLICKGKPDSEIKVVANAPDGKTRHHSSKIDITLEELLVGGKTFEEINERLFANCPTRFKDKQQALEYVKGVFKCVQRQKTPSYRQFEAIQTTELIQITYAQVI